jgi:hypothetical protein
VTPSVTEKQALARSKTGGKPNHRKLDKSPDGFRRRRAGRHGARAVSVRSRMREAGRRMRARVPQSRPWRVLDYSLPLKLSTTAISTASSRKSKRSPS